MLKLQPKTSSQGTQLVLGTAQWGWNVPPKVAFQLLDVWLKMGHKALDCATNYPINRNPADFRAAEKILCEYVKANGLNDLDITMKVGSMDNSGLPEHNLSPSYLIMAGEEYLRLFGANLRCLMVHWDNRDDLRSISATLHSLGRLRSDFGLRPGLSGIARPDIYVQANADFGFDFDIQLKNNVLQSNFEHYASFLGAKNRFFSYGINAGGVKLDAHYTAQSTFLQRGGQPEKTAEKLAKIAALLPDLNRAFVRPPLKTMNHLGLVHAGLHPYAQGILLGVSSLPQLNETLDFWRNLEVFDYTDAWSKLAQLT